MGLAKQRKKSRKAIRRGVRQQIGYVKRNLKSIRKQVESGAKLTVLTKKEYKDLLVIGEVLRQQEKMYKEKSHHVEGRIVSIHEPHVRPIVRGKAGAEVEFGSKMSISVVEGMVRIETLSWDNYNESTELREQIERYKSRYGYYPESVHVDKIYQTRENRNYCKERKIRISGPKLGRPILDKERSSREKLIEKLDGNARQPVEGKFGNMKRKYGLSRVYAKLQRTSENEIAIIALVLNLEKVLREGRAPFIFCFYYYMAKRGKTNTMRRTAKYFCVQRPWKSQGLNGIAA
jgi:uncharacterized protein (UPF0262 family)